MALAERPRHHDLKQIVEEAHSDEKGHINQVVAHDPWNRYPVGYRASKRSQRPAQSDVQPGSFIYDPPQRLAAIARSGASLAAPAAHPQPPLSGGQAFITQCQTSRRARSRRTPPTHWGRPRRRESPGRQREGRHQAR